MCTCVGSTPAGMMLQGTFLSLPSMCITVQSPEASSAHDHLQHSASDDPVCCLQVWVWAT
jgi:hypothetical protein